MKTNLASFDRPMEAEALTLFLKSCGVDAILQDERRLQRFWFWTTPRAGVHVLVPSDQFQNAHQILQEKTGSFILKKAVHCPACYSSRVHYPAMTRKNILPTLVAQVMVALGFLHHEYYCEDCHHTWRPPALRKFGSRSVQTP